jgi:3-deoxy-7-phosphoheptulonate synthase
MLRAAADRHELKLITEVMEISQIELIEKHADVLQVGARNMQNFSLLRELGRATTAGAAETRHLRDHRGMAAVCGVRAGRRQYERDPVRAGHSHVRELYAQHAGYFAIPVVQQLSHLPVVVDPSHGTGRRDKVASMARAAVAAGADGLIIEVHCDPDHALSDGAQSMFPAQFERLMAELRIIAPAIGRSVCVEPVARRGWSR